MASHGQGAVGRADGDDFGAQDTSQEVQGDVCRVGVHAVFVPPRPGLATPASR